MIDRRHKLECLPGLRQYRLATNVEVESPSATSRGHVHRAQTKVSSAITEKARQQSTL